MELIDRYLSEVRRYLSYKNREDILKELRSALTDALENQFGSQPTQEQVAALLKDFGAPQVVAARYYPEGQYLVGPALYPLFKLIAGIVISTVIALQIFGWLMAYIFAGQPASALATASSIFNGALIALGWVVIVFMILQRFEVRPSGKAQPWNPESLPDVTPKEDVNRVERVVAIIANVIVLSILTYFQGKVGMVTSPGGTFYEDPVIARYFIWICATILVNIGLSVYLLWQGRWSTPSRWVQVGADLLSIVVLGLLVVGHQTWLQSQGVSGFTSAIEKFSTDFETNGQIMMMIGFWFGLSIGLMASILGTGKSVVRLVRHTFLSQR